jgi:hypothetical protein
MRGRAEKNVGWSTLQTGARAFFLAPERVPLLGGLTVHLAERTEVVGQEAERMNVSTKRAAISVALIVGLSLLHSASDAAELWTFCVASSSNGGEVWITRPFASSSDRRALETEMQTTLKRRQGERTLAQCPQPSSDKVAVVNAQTTAIEFNRNLGAVMHELPEDEFPPHQ